MALVDPSFQTGEDQEESVQVRVVIEEEGGVPGVVSSEQSESEHLPVAVVSGDACPPNTLIERLRSLSSGSSDVPVANVVDVSDSPVQYADATIARVPENLHHLILMAHRNGHLDMNIEEEGELLRQRRLRAIQVMQWEARYRRAFMTSILLFLLVMIVGRSMGRSYSYIGYVVAFLSCCNCLYCHSKWKNAVKDYNLFRQTQGGQSGP